MYYDNPAKFYRRTDVDSQLLGIHQDVSIHDALKVQRLVTVLWTAVHNDFLLAPDADEDSPTSAFGLLAVNNLGLVLFHSGPQAVLPRP